MVVVYLAERSLIKLAVADAATTHQESDLSTTTAPASLGGTAADLGDRSHAQLTGWGKIKTHHLIIRVIARLGPVAAVFRANHRRWVRSGQVTAPIHQLEEIPRHARRPLPAATQR